MGCKKDINQQIEALLSQVQTVINETAVPVDERIQRVADIYRQAEKLANENDLEDQMKESLLVNSARFFAEYGKYKEALSRFTLLVTLRESLYGVEHPVTATAYHDFGEVCRILCDYPKALDYNQKALDIRSRVYGEKHAETATSYNDTGLVYFFLGDYDKALELISKAKAIREEVVDNNHVDMAESYLSLGLLWFKQEDYSTAYESYSNALTITEKILGTEDRKTAVAYYGIGLTDLFLAKRKDAVNNISKAKDIYEKTMGMHHPETAMVYVGMGIIFSCVKGYSKALEYYTKSLEITKEALGDEHINTAGSYCALGLLKQDMGEQEEAVECLKKSLNINEKVFGLAHPDTADSYNTMGSYYYSQANIVKAYEYYVNAYEFYKMCPSSEFINNKIKEAKANMESLEYKEGEETVGTRDLFLETLTKIGCQYEIDPDEGYISFGYQGENFVASATNDEWYVRIWDTYWGHVELYDVDEFSRLRKAVNHANLNCTTMTVYTINEEGKTVDVHCKSKFPFISQIPNLDDYLRNELGDFFNAHHFVGSEMAKLREQEQEDNTQAN